MPASFFVHMVEEPMNLDTLYSNTAALSIKQKNNIVQFPVDDNSRLSWDLRG